MPALLRAQWPLLAVLAAAAALRIGTLDAFGFGLDEIASASSTRHGAADTGRRPEST